MTWSQVVGHEGQENDDEMTGGDRRLTRRDTEDAVERAFVKRMYPHYSKHLLEGAVNRKGEKLRKVVADQVRANRPLQKKLSSQFWCKLVQDFELVPDLASDDMPPPGRD